MTGTTAQRKQVRSAKSRAEEKAEITDRNARAIIEAETKLLEAKNAKLRKARLENETQKSATFPLGAERRSEETGKPRKRARPNTRQPDGGAST